MPSKRNTIQKEIIFNTLYMMQNHPSADMVYDKVIETFPSISRATIYRVLNQLADDRLILKISMINSADCFDHRSDDHYHIRCCKCGKVDDIDLPYMKTLTDSAVSLTSYSILRHTVIFEGICPQCLNDEVR